MAGLFKKKKGKDHFRKLKRTGVDEEGELKEKKSPYSKFGSKAQTYNGVNFDSALEVNVYKHFLMYKDSGLLKDVVPHPPAFLLLPAQYIDDKFKETKNKNRKMCIYQSVCYNADFKIVLKSGKEIFIDTKSFATITDSFVIKQKLLYQAHKHHLCILVKELIPYLPNVIKELEKGRIIAPVTKKQLSKIIDRYKAG